MPSGQSAFAVAACRKDGHADLHRRRVDLAWALAACCCVLLAALAWDESSVELGA